MRGKGRSERETNFSKFYALSMHIISFVVDVELE